MTDANDDHSDVSNLTGVDGEIPSKPIAAVLAGAGARGAYEAGFIATLLPHLNNTRPTIFVGTSAGAINAALLASVADRSAEAARDEIIRRWGTIHKKKVLSPFLRTVPSALIQYLGALFFGTPSPTSFLSTAPLADSLRDPALIDWQAINNNIKTGRVEVLAVAATEAGSGRTKVFYEASPNSAVSKYSLARVASDSSAPFVGQDDKQAIDYVSTELNSEHVRASAAIPVLFPPVKIESAAHASFFVDGGVRLNAPLKPALQFRANGLVVVSTDPRHFGTSEAVKNDKPPSMQDQVLQIMRATFADRMIEDIRTLLDRNEAAREQEGSDGKAQSGKIAKGEIPIIFGGPLDQERVGSIAERAIKQILHSPRLIQSLLHPDLALLDWFLSVSSTSGPDILSYLLFEPKFISAALDAGIQDAAALINDCPDEASLWSSMRKREARKMVAWERAKTTSAQASPLH